MARLLKTDGSVPFVEPKNGKTFTLDELQGYVGGDIECVHASKRLIFVMNEEGKLRGLKVNLKATVFYRILMRNFDLLVGDVLLCTTDEIE